MNFSFPEGFELGVSSAATQIEGGESRHSWNDWCHQGHIKDGSDPARADEHWSRWEEDTALMASMGIRHARIGVEWSRLMPLPGTVDEEAVAHYRAELTALREAGIHVLLTIHHFTNPLWFEALGGFRRRENLHYYLELTELVVRRFGDLVSDYITINEPNVYASNGFLFGLWPPGQTSFGAYFAVLSNLSYCHIRAYELIHRLRRDMGYTDTMVGFANHVRVFEPREETNPRHRLLARTAEWGFQGAVTLAMARGEFRPPLVNFLGLRRGEYADFIGVNYYSRSTVSALADGVRENTPRNDLDWEIYPEGLIRCTEKLLAVLDRPVWVTENGTCDNTDAFRARYICEHLRAICDSGLPFARYYHWCFCDNFEWLEGESARFGLVHVDYATQKRTVKRSGEFYSAMIREKGVTEELYDTYVKDQTYHVR